MPIYPLKNGGTYRTMGRRPRQRMSAEEKITKKRLGNPVLWKQLEAISNGTYVNHLGRGHERKDSPSVQELQWTARQVELEAERNAKEA